MNPTGTVTHGPMLLDEGHAPAPGSTEHGMCDGLAHDGGTWHWPARV